LSAREKRSAKEIPREEIPWYPTIQAEKCTGCGSCVEFCIHDVYELSEKARVKNPFNCIVGCSGCLSKCPESAISFPSLAEFRKNIRAVRERYLVKK